MMTAKQGVNRDLIIILVSRVLQMAVLLLTLRAMTTRLSPVEVGNFSLLMSIATLFIWIFISPIGLYVNRHTHEWWEKGTIWLNYGREGIYGVAVAIFTALALTLWEIIFQPEWARHLVWLGPATGLYIICALGNNTIIPAINLFGKRISYSVLYVGSQILCLAFSWTLAGIAPRGEYWFLGQTAGFAVASLLALPIFLKTAPPKPGASHRISSDWRAGLVAIAAFCLPIAVTSGLSWVQFQSYRIAVGNLVSLEFLGLFFAGYSVSAGIMGAVEVTAGQFFGPYFYRHVQESQPERQHDAWAAYMSALYPMIIVIVMVVAALATPIAHLLLAPKFWSASSFVIAGAITEGVRTMGGTYALAAHVSKRTRALLLPYAAGAACIALLLPGGAWLLGEKVVVPAMLVSAAVYLLVMHVTMTRHAGTRFTILGWRWLVYVGAFLAGLALLRPALAGFGYAGDFGLVAAGGIAILAAFLLVLRDARPTLARFAK